MEQLTGLMNYGVSLLTMIGIYSVMVLGLNLQWGLAALLNVGVAGFFAVGAYVSAIVTTAETSKHLGGYDMPFGVGLLAAMVFSGLVAWGIGRICIRLRSDYLAIATIGIAEILRLILKNEQWATNGARGISNISRPFETLPQPWGPISYMVMIFAIVGLIYWFLERAQKSPWGRTMRAIRDSELAALAAGKNVEKFRIQAFIIGSVFMGLGGALTAHYFKFVGPEATDPLLTTFLLWVMLIVGGSGNNRGAILGVGIMWTVWSVTEIVAFRFTGEWAIRIPYMRMFLIGLVLQIMLQKYTGGILPEKRPKGREKSISVQD